MDRKRLSLWVAALLAVLVGMGVGVWLRVMQSPVALEMDVME